MNFLQRKENRRNLFLAVGISLIAVIVLGYMLWRQKEALLTYSWNVRLEYIPLSFLAFSLSLGTVAWIWAQIINTLGYKQPFIAHFRNFSIANFTKRLPGTIWYVVGRAALYKSATVPANLVVVASGIEFLISGISSILISIFFSITLLERLKIPYHTFIIITIVGLAVTIIALNPRTISWLFRHLKIPTQQVHYSKVLQWIGGYCLVWLLNGLLPFCVGNIIAPINIQYVPLFIGSVAIVNLLTSMLLFAPSNLGMTEVGLSVLLTVILPSSVAVVLAILSRFLLTLYDLTWALIAILLIHQSDSSST